MKQYDSSDLLDINALARCDLEWASICISDLRNEVKRLQEEIKTNKHFCSIHFDSVIEKASMYSYLIDNRRDYHDLEVERLTEEMGE